MSTPLNLLTKTYLEVESNIDIDLKGLVKSASSVIAPLSPIRTFAARNPWAGMEKQSFESVARRLKETCDVEIFPNDFVLKSAWNRGEINEEFLEKGIEHWLDQQPLEMACEDAKDYCRAALKNVKRSSQKIDEHVLKSLAKKLHRYHFQIKVSNSLRTYSEYLEKLNEERVAEELNRHIIKWCKLYLDDSQTAWSMPNREKGFYYAWRNLIQHDPALNKSIRNLLKDLPLGAEEALKKALLGLELSFSELKDYLEAHLLSLPGWAGMMLWRSQQSVKEKSLLMEYLAVRVLMEWAMIKHHLPIRQPKEVENEALIESLIANWFYWSDLSINSWLKLSYSEVKAHLTLANRFDKITRNRIWLEAWEKTYEDEVMKLITSSQQTIEKKAEPTIAQFAFCIDVRSEPFRRKLEEADLSKRLVQLVFLVYRLKPANLAGIMAMILYQLFLNRSTK